jgi:hypothetical protein
MMLRALLALALLLAAAPAFAQSQPGNPVPVQQAPTRLDSASKVGHSHTASATITLPGIGGWYIYITGIDIIDCAGATTVTGVAPTFITTTGLVGAPQYMLGSGSAAAGQCTPTYSGNLSTPLRSATTGTDVTFVLPAFATNQTVSVNVYYDYAPQ